MGDLTKNFSRNEFDCPCCGRNEISPEFVQHLQYVRDSAGPLHVVSGYRCRQHNAFVGGKPDSAHVRGLAVDIQCSNSSQRFTILEAALRLGFVRIGIDETFIHLDIDKSLPRQVVWMY